MASGCSNGLDVGFVELGYAKVAVLGVVQGITELLPISSTAHLTLASYLLGLDQSAFVKTFEIAIQSGAILAVILIYWRKPLDMEVMKKVAAAFIPTAIIGFISTFFTAIIGVKFLLKYIQSKTFVWFGVYRIVIAAVFTLLLVL